MSECPKNDAGHEQSHRLVKRPEPDPNADIRIDVPGINALFRFDPGSSIEGPPGLVHACKHCRLLYFEPDA